MFNPTRRNRNIGTAKQGHGQNNWLRIAERYSDPGMFWSRLGRYTMAMRPCGGRELPIFVEETREDCVHACTVADVVTVLNWIPAQDYALLAAVVLRQPKRKEQILSGVWGRFIYSAHVGRGQDGTAAGPMVIIEAGAPNRAWKRSKEASPAEVAERDRLEADGHVLRHMRSHIQVQSSWEAVRATQLYRTLPHEIGHLVDYCTKVPPDAIQQDELEEAYWRIPTQEKEAFAHRYADEFRARMQAEGKIPFPRIESWDDDGLRQSDFVQSK